MNIERYEHARHYELMAKWLKRHELPVPPPEILSDCGYVVDSTVIGFLMKTNSGVCFVDHMVSDPDSEKEHRDKAIETLCMLLENAGRVARFKIIEVMVRLPVMKERFKTRGYADGGNFNVYYRHL